MSLFNPFMGGDLDDDPIFGFHSRAMNQMNAMMSSVMSDAFGDMMGGMGMGMGMGGFPSLMGGPMMAPMVGGQMMPHQRRPPPPLPRGGMMSPFDMLGGMHANNGLSFSTSSMTSMSYGPDGRPQVYQATSSSRSAPGGVRETKQTVSDSRSGTKKMAIGHHIGDRAHIIEKKQNMRTGHREEHVELVNLSDDETEEFNHEWESATRGHQGHVRVANPRRIAHYGGVTIEDVTETPARLALPAPSPSTSHTSQRVRHPKTSPSTSSKSHERAKKRDHGSSSSSRAAKQHRSKQNH